MIKFVYSNFGSNAPCNIVRVRRKKRAVKTFLAFLWPQHFWSIVPFPLRPSSSPSTSRTASLLLLGPPAPLLVYVHMLFLDCVVTPGLMLHTLSLYGEVLHLKMKKMGDCSDLSLLIRVYQRMKTQLELGTIFEYYQTHSKNPFFERFLYRPRL